MTKNQRIKFILAAGAAWSVMAGTAQAQNAASTDKAAEILVTGSRIKQDPTKSALPLQVISQADILRNSISSPEQLIGFLTTTGTSSDNLASNADVVTGAQRGFNGASAANLRGQGSAATLVLLNGRRVAAHGLNGSAVDVNQIPFAALERVEVLKDGASAIYGTDAVGGVINFITKRNFRGITLNGFTDVTEGGGGNIYRLSGTVGYGDLDRQGFNVMAAVSKSWNQALYGDQRSFVNGNQPNRGLSIDTRGTPIATMFPVNANPFFFPTGTLLGGSSTATTLKLVTPTGATNVAIPNTLLAGLVFPGTTTRASGGINTLDMPGGAGCSTMDGGMAYDDVLWQNSTAAYACAWDTGRAAVIQQPIQTLTYYGRATAKLGSSEIFAEVTGSNADSAKRFSNNQYSSNNTTLEAAYPLNALTSTTYNAIYNQLVAVFPAISANYGKPIAFRWRCIPCDVREYTTTTKTFRAALGLDGPLFGDWDYRVGASYARSESSSVLGSGFHYRGTFAYGGTDAEIAAQLAATGVAGATNGAPDPRAPTAPGATYPGIIGLINSGILNPFSLEQSPQAIAGLKAVSAKGVTLYGGRYEVKQADGSISGSLFSLPGGMVKLAAGVDFRRETYSFNGSAAAANGYVDIFNAAFDNVNALTPKSRDIKAAYAEILLPLFRGLEVTAAGRVDNYTGFGTTFNPKVSVKFQPARWVMFRGSYNTSFRVPTFNQVFYGQTVSPYSGRDLVDPVKCPSGVVSTTDPNCFIIQPNIISGGNPVLRPETAKQASLGVVFTPLPRVSLSVDWWMVNVNNTIQTLSLTQLFANASLFANRYIRDGSGTITAIDQTWFNAGARQTQGLEISLRAATGFLGGMLTGGVDGSMLLHKVEKLTPNSAFGPSLIGVYSPAGDLGLRWKHNAFINWTSGIWTLGLTQIYRDGYANQVLPGIANGAVTRPEFNPRVKPYILYNLSAGARINERYNLTFGVKNLFNTDPPFAISYDSNTGSGGSWEPRVADPRGRSFTVAVEAKF